MVQFVNVTNMARWIQRESVEKIIGTMIDYLERDFKRWEKFDKIARVASHTPFGVIELMPTSDGEEYSFKYVSTGTLQTPLAASRRLPRTACWLTLITATPPSFQK